MESLDCPVHAFILVDMNNHREKVLVRFSRLQIEAWVRSFQGCKGCFLLFGLWRRAISKGCDYALAVWHFCHWMLRGCNLFITHPYIVVHNLGGNCAFPLRRI